MFRKEGKYITPTQKMFGSWVAQMVEYLTSQYEALSTNPGTIPTPQKRTIKQTLKL
jgi:hypothetical protein